MRRSIAPQTGGNVCFFCDLRWAVKDLAPTVHRRPLIRARRFHSTRDRKGPAGASAAQKEDDDDDDDFPLLRQNAPNAFAPPQPFIPRSRIQRPKPEESETPSFTIRRHVRAGKPNQRVFTFRNSVDEEPAQLSPSQEARLAAPRHSVGGGRPEPMYPERRPSERVFTSKNSVEHDPAQPTPSMQALLAAAAQRHSAGGRRPGPAQSERSPPQRVFTFRNSVQEEPAQPTPSTQSAEPPKQDTVYRPMFQRDQLIDDPTRAFGDARNARREREEAAQAEEAREYSRLEERLNQRKTRRGNRIDDAADLPPKSSMSHRPKASRFESAYRVKGGGFDVDLDAALNEEDYALYSGERKKKAKTKQPAVTHQEPVRPKLAIPEFTTVQNLAQLMKLKIDDLVQKLEEEGFEGARYDHTLDAETSAMFADMYGFEPIAPDFGDLQDLVAQPLPDDMSIFPPRPPIVTIMGHVDHGKTTILDYLRKSTVAAGEHGGITQHIGAFSVTMPGSNRQMTFLDTPGHEAFLDMRRRGANVTDIVVLVVAADDSVKPQTIEAIKHALQAKVQLIVAINKVDKEDANIERVKQDLTRQDIVVEDYGGDYQAIAVSGKTGQGMVDLEEAIITLSDVLDLRADQEGRAEGAIIESKVTNAGRVATVLVRRGILKVGDFIVAGPTWARVRTLRNDQGELVKAAYPGDPVQVDGWRGSDPVAGLEVIQADSEEHAKDVMDIRQQIADSADRAAESIAINQMRSQEAEARAKVLEWEAENNINKLKHETEGWIEKTDVSGIKLVPFVVKADVAGSVEAIVAAVEAIGNHEVRASVIHSGAGMLTESDIKMLAESDVAGHAISFNQPVDGSILRLAEAATIGVLDHNIIYKVTDDVKAKVEAAMPVTITQRVLGEAEIGQIFEVTIKKVKTKIAGCRVTNGTISRSNKVRVLRHGEVVFTGTLDSLKNVKKDVTEMRKGTECGMGFRDWDEFEEGDQIQCFEEKEEKRSLY